MLVAWELWPRAEVLNDRSRKALCSILSHQVDALARAAASRGTTDIKRNVWFYRFFTKNPEGAIDRIDAATICDAVRGLTPEMRYLPTGDNNGVAVEVPADHSDRLEMLRVRWTDHPGTWTKAGERGELALDADKALTEPTFVRFFAGNIAAIDVNRSGPWPTALRDFLRERLPEKFGKFQMVQIPDRTAMERLARITSVTKLDLQVANHTLARIPQGEHTYLDPLKGTAALGGPGAIEVVWKRFNFSDKLNTESLKALVQYFIEHQGDPKDPLKIDLIGKDHSGKRQSFNLRRDFVQAEVEIHRTVTRRIDAADAFEKLRLAYNSVTDRFPPQTFLANDPQ